MPEDRPPENKNNPSKDVVGDIFKKGIKKDKPSSLFDAAKPVLPEEHGSLGQEKKSEPAVAPAVPAERSFVFRAKSKNALPFGIDVGDHSLKIVQLAKGDAGPELSKIILKEFPGDVIEKKQDRGAFLIKIFKDTLKEHNLKNEAFCALSSSKVQIKNLVFPKMPFKEIEGAIAWEIRQMSAGEAQGVTYDYVVLDEDQLAHQEKIEVLLIVSPKKDVLDYLSFFESAGIKILAVDTESLSHLASLNYNQLLQSQEVALVLDFGGNASRLDIIKDRQLRFTRGLTTGGLTLTQAIKNYCHVSFEEAEALKKNYSLMKAQEDSSGHWLQVKNAVNLLLEKLAMDIDHTFKYYSYQMTKSAVTAFTKVILSGGLANLEIVSSFLRDRVKAEIIVDNPLKRIHMPQGTAQDAAIPANEHVRFGVAFGLALRGLNQEK